MSVFLVACAGRPVHLLTSYVFPDLKYVGLASYTVLIYDHLLTLGDEIKYIWRKKKRGPRTYSFLVVRFL